MKQRTSLILIGALILLILGGNYLYTYLKEKPPTALIKLVTETDPPPPLPEGDLAPLQVPEGFTATIYTRETPGARVMIRDPRGTMLVSLTSAGKVVALPDLNTDGKADSTITVLEGLNLPHGLAIVCPETGSASADQDGCKLYVAETGELKSYAYDADTYKATLEETLTAFPHGEGHYTRTLLMHPNGEELLISVGSSCNVCEEEEPYRAKVLSLNLESKAIKTFGSGLRNSVFVAVDPKTEKVWASENGRDMIGDDIPPDEVNILEEGKNYGWPICYGNGIHDTDFDKRQYFRDPCADSTSPHIELQAHSAALGLGFIPDSGWPEEMRGDLLVAYHGSWNRSTPTGYKVVRFDLDTNRNASSGPIDFLTGFLPANESDTDNAIGRPADVLVENGVAYVSDDRAGAVYRITPNK